MQIFMHKDEGHWLSGEPDAGDKESFKIGGRWFKPNYHAHIVFDWMNHDTGKSCKLNDDDMMEMQTLASDILSMERGQSKVETGKEHLERNDFILEKQFAKDTYRSIFSREEAKTIKSVMEAFGKDREDYRAIGTFLVFTADKKEDLSNSEYRKATREVDDVAIGRYEQAQKRGNSMKL